MKLGRTSFVYFLAQIVATAVGFLVTIYLARILGAEVLGIYYLVIGVVSWFSLPATVGITSAINKRISEGGDQGEYLAAGGLVMGGMLLVLAMIVVGFRAQIDAYIGYPAADFIVLLVVVATGSSYVTAVLSGQHRVEIAGVLTLVQTISRGLLQVLAVYLGYEVAGILFGHAIGSVISILIGLLFVSLTVSLPSKRHFESLLSFAQFSWLGQIRARAFNRMDVIVLGFFVSSSLIGIYSVSWNVASFLGLFASSISATLFPELSRLSSQNKSHDVRELVEVSISYAGLFHIPGLIGAALLGERILRIYGREFQQGSIVLVILVFAYLVHSYNQQIQTALDSVDRPDLTFRANAVIIGSNVVLNVSLIYLYGWIGAAVATTLSMALGYAVGHWYLARLIRFEFPTSMVLKQTLSALCMGAVVYLGVFAENTYSLLSNNVAIVLLLVAAGAGVYFSMLFTISPRFRASVRDNLPGWLPA